MYNRVFFLLVIFPTVTFARIGETLEQCSQRYGTIIESESWRNEESFNYVFAKGHYRVQVWSTDGRHVEGIVYRKLASAGNPQTSIGDEMQINKEEIDYLLSANKLNSDWVVKRSTDIGFPFVWETKDSKLKAIYSISHNDLSIERIGKWKKFLTKMLQQQKQRQELDKLKGF